MRRSGTSLVEVLLVILLVSAVVPAGWTLLARHREAGSRVIDRAEGLETIRTLAWILEEEVGGSLEGRDWMALGGDSLSLRAFRGHALLDSVATDHGTVLACYRGTRVPAPEKDSVLLLGVDGRWRAHDLVARSATTSRCDDLVEGGRSERWTLAPDPEASVLARIFEVGSYHLVDRALRYRRGDGGRQPLTPEMLEAGLFMGPGEGGKPLAWEVRLRSFPGNPEALAGSTAGSWRGRVR